MVVQKLNTYIYIVRIKKWSWISRSSYNTCIDTGQFSSFLASVFSTDLFTEAKPVASADLLPAPRHPKLFKWIFVFPAFRNVQPLECVQTLCPSSGPRHNQPQTDRLNLKGQNKQKTFFWPVAIFFSRESQSWDEVNQKQDGSVMIGLVASVQFSPRTEGRRFKNKGLRYYTKLFNNVFLASHWASQKWWREIVISAWFIFMLIYFQTWGQSFPPSVDFRRHNDKLVQSQTVWPSAQFPACRSTSQKDKCLRCALFIYLF